MKKLVFLFIACLMVTACEKEVISEGYSEMEGFYVESCGLPHVTIDSVKSFSIKMSNYITDHPDSKKHSLFPKIQANIRFASLRITIVCDTTWNGETHVNF